MTVDDHDPRPTTESDPLARFAAEVGIDDPVTVVGGRSQWDVGGPVAAEAREVVAPEGVVAFSPAEMTVRVRAGTGLDALLAVLAGEGQTVALPRADDATVGGVLAVGESDVRRLGRGPLRDTLLETRYVSAEGRLVKAGGPTVKNVSGYDLCRLLVGSLGVLGFLAEVVLRTRPLPAASRWLAGLCDPRVVRAALYWPSAILWDGATTWCLLEGHEPDVEAQSQVAERLGLRPVAGPPDLPPFRTSMAPSELASLSGDFVAEIGVGVVHRHERAAPRPVPEPLRQLNQRVKRQFDPTGRLNPGRDVFAR